MGLYGLVDPCIACGEYESTFDNPFCLSCDASDLEPGTTCPCCGEPLLADQEWRLREDLKPGVLETEQPCDQPYVHAWCDDRLNSTLSGIVCSEEDAGNVGGEVDGE